ncbi:MAG: hypothetical protein ABIF88_02545 [archaeon]
MDINPSKVTQPFQLLASWIVGMLILVWEFLSVCGNTEELWLKISSFVVALFLSLLFIRVIFLLQTKYRPEMQDSENYQKIYMAKMRQELNSSKPLEMGIINGATIWQPKK